MSVSDFVDAVRTSLAPALTARGFGPGGPGRSPDGSASFLFCTGAQAFAARWPSTAHLLIRHGPMVELRDPRECLDLVVEASATGEIVRLDFEFVALDLLLQAAHLHDLAHRCSIGELQIVDADDAASRIGGAVDALMPLGHGT